MKYYIIVYKNTLSAMKAEDIFSKHNFKFKVMPTPTSITQSCGICSRFDNIEDINKILSEEMVEYKNIYVKDSDGFNLFK